jgi:hypothetical protein
MKLSLSSNLLGKLVWVPVILLCKIFMPCYTFKPQLCRNWPFSPPNSESLWITLMLASSLVWSVKLGSFGSSFWNLNLIQYPFDGTSTRIEPWNLVFTTIKIEIEIEISKFKFWRQAHWSFSEKLVIRLNFLDRWSILICQKIQYFHNMHSLNLMLIEYIICIFGEIGWKHIALSTKCCYKATFGRFWKL